LRHLLLLALVLSVFMLIGCGDFTSPTAPSQVVSIPTAIVSTAGESQSALKTSVGGLDLDGYCRSKGFAGATLTKDRFGPGHAYGNWACSPQSGGKPSIIVVKNACDWQYPSLQTLAQARDNNDAYSWECKRVRST
jgi:hypothetical protein